MIEREWGTEKERKREQEALRIELRQLIWISLKTKVGIQIKGKKEEVFKGKG